MNATGQAILMPTAPPPSRASDEPAHEMLHQLDDHIQVRRYSPYAVAEVFVAGPTDGAGERALPILAGYVAGKNHGEHTVALTPPVTQILRRNEVWLRLP